MIPMLDIPKLHAPIQQALDEATLSVLRSGKYINGPAVSSFEQKLAKQIGADEVIGVGSGTDALIVSLMALGVRPGDKIVTTPYSFFATTGAIIRLGAIPIFVDIHPETFNIDEQQIEHLIDADTVGILPVHLFGRMANMAKINTIARKHHLWVLEDGAQALGATSDNGSSAGGTGKAGCFSFFPAKNIGAAGDAGAVATSDRVLAQNIRQLRSHGAAAPHHHVHIGGNFRMDTLQAALLETKLPHLEHWNQKRRQAANNYRQLFAAHDAIVSPVDTAGHIYSQFVIQMPEHCRAGIIDALDKQHIEWSIYYPVPLHLQPALKYLRYRRGDFPVAENVANTTLALPINPTITDEDQREVVKSIINGLNISRATQ